MQTSNKSAAAAPYSPQPVSARAATGKKQFITVPAAGSIPTAKMRALRSPAGETSPLSRKRPHPPTAVQAGEALPVAQASKRRHTRTMRVLPTPHKPVRLASAPTRPPEEEPAATAVSTRRELPAPPRNAGEDDLTVPASLPPPLQRREDAGPQPSVFRS